MQRYDTLHVHDVPICYSIYIHVYIHADEAPRHATPALYCSDFESIICNYYYANILFIISTDAIYIYDA